MGPRVLAEHGLRLHTIGPVGRRVAVAKICSVAVSPPL